MGRISWSLTAQHDLESIGDYIAKDSPFYAVDFVERILQYVEEVADFQERGRVVPEFARRDLRELIFHNYRVVYQEKGGDISVVSVSHASMDMLRKAKRESWDIG